MGAGSSCRLLPSNAFDIFGEVHHLGEGQSVVLLVGRGIGAGCEELKSVANLQVRQRDVFRQDVRAVATWPGQRDDPPTSVIAGRANGVGPAPGDLQKAGINALIDVDPSLAIPLGLSD